MRQTTLGRELDSADYSMVILSCNSRSAEVKRSVRKCSWVQNAGWRTMWSQPAHADSPQRSSLLCFSRTGCTRVTRQAFHCTCREPGFRTANQPSTAFDSGIA